MVDNRIIKLTYELLPKAYYLVAFWLHLFSDSDIKKASHFCPCSVLESALSVSITIGLVTASSRF